MTIQDVLIKRGYWTKDGVNKSRMKEAHRTLLQGVRIAYIGLNHVKRGIRYGDPISKYAVFWSYLATYAAYIMGIKNIIARQTGVVMRTEKGNKITVAAPDAQPRQVSMDMCLAMRAFWEQTHWQGEWGVQPIGTIDGTPNKGIPDRPEDKYPRTIAGAALKKGQLCEVRNGKAYPVKVKK